MELRIEPKTTSLVGIPSKIENGVVFKGTLLSQVDISQQKLVLTCSETPIWFWNISLSSPMEMESLPNGNSVAAVVAAAAAAAAAAPSSKFNQLAESLKLEHQFLRVPFEHFKKSIRANHRIVEKEMSAVISGVADAANADLSGDEAVHHLNSLVSRLQGLKRKVIGLLTLRLVPKKRGEMKERKRKLLSLYACVSFGFQ